MNASPHWKRPLPLLIGVLLAAGLAAFFAAPRWSGPRERIAERAENVDQDADSAAATKPSAEADKDADTASPAETDAPGMAKFDPEGLRLAGLRIDAVRYRDIRSRLALTGTVEPNLTGVAKVTPRVAGKIIAVRVNVGSRVRAGQGMASLSSAELAQAQAAYRQAAARAAVAVLDRQRQEKLASLGAFASPGLEAARSQAATARAEARTSRTGVAAARAGVDQAESQLQVLQTGLGQAQAQAAVTQSRLSRAELLLKAGIVSQQGWEQARADNQQAQADVAAARAKIAQGRSAIETSRAALAAAQANLAAAQQRAQVGVQALTREQAVYRGGYATSQQLVAARATLRQARLEQAAAADSVRLLGGRPGAGDLLEITAPIGGEVTERAVTLGESVTPSQMLFTIMDLRTVWVQLSAYATDVAAIRVGQPVTIASDTAPGRSFHGSVSYVSDLVDPNTHTVKVRCVIRNAGEPPRGAPLRPGAYVRGTIAVEGRYRALAVPAVAVQQLSGRNVLFVPGGRAGEFQARAVDVGPRFGPWIEIRAGLKVGDRVVTQNAFLVKSQAMKSQLGDEDEDQERKR